MNGASERPCVKIFDNLERRINRTVNNSAGYSLNDLKNLYNLAERLSRVDRYTFDEGKFVAGPVHLLVFTSQGLKFIVNYEYARSFLHLPLPSTSNIANRYIDFKDYLSNVIGGNRFDHFTSVVSTSLRK